MRDSLPHSDAAGPGLHEILDGVDAAIDANVAVNGIAYRSDAVQPGDVFFAVAGFAHDGHAYIADAVAHGAAAIVAERRDEGAGDVPYAVVPDSRVALARASARFYGDPSGSMDVVGITGTNGKTTTVYLTDSILRSAGRVTGLIGTVETRVAGERLPSERTTPESADLHALFARMRDAGVTAACMEVSSHAIDLHRVDAVRFAVVAFTNLTQDHLDYHHTLQEYYAVKRRLFTEFDVGRRVVNIDDELGAGLALELDDVLTIGISGDADVRASDVQLGARESRFRLATPWGTADVVLPLAGAFNVSNALVASACALAIGVDLESVVRGLEDAPQVPGRMERVDAGQSFAVYVDYAHTPDSLEKALAALSDLTEGRLIVVFGCGGDRDRAKRPAMAAAAARGADYAVLTSDNPRTEDPVGILRQVEDGIRDSGTPYHVEVDRRSAIAQALALAAEGDAVLIAGKGHEDYQIFADRTIHFDDREVVREELERSC
ncbi:MAG: UDP-N-acetylmuramoyl-L-alanyl-D-glutamate--2,6-diaminopimelate ligase [Actinobacteria bacterium HGW-Actinobacteria-10]|jgi:UDP-N-acetylmuramoyl-L-alanyl-D-glutamate--2,6-diaminopimelate ligase|nr:MAG: UDP-N-acetylmuramoyl-L-alanyl-D-glutamate--2,6-diaminopimelate ligase [Actinobacteria bacterium HGW-Actinobacteria-10]